MLRHPEPTVRGHEGAPRALGSCLDSALTSDASGCRLSSKPLLPSDAYELGAGMRKRHKGPEEEHEASVGTGKARGRSQPWDEPDAPTDFMSQVSDPVFPVCRRLGPEFWRGCGVHTPFAGLLAPLLHRNRGNGCLASSSLPHCPGEGNHGPQELRFLAE